MVIIIIMLPIICGNGVPATYWHMLLVREGVLVCDGASAVQAVALLA
jgi:hypothetical protein